MWNPLYGTGARSLQGLARVHGVGIFEDLMTYADSGASFADMTVNDFSIPFDSLPVIDASSFVVDDWSAPTIDVAPVDIIPADVTITPTIDVTPVDGAPLDVAAPDTSAPDSGPTNYPQEVAMSAPDTPLDIGDVLKSVGGGAMSILKMVLSNAPGAINAATKLLTTQAQIDQAKASLQRGQVPAGYAITKQGQLIPPGYHVNAAGQLVPASAFTSIANHVRANPVPYIIGGVALVYLISKHRSK